MSDADMDDIRTRRDELQRRENLLRREQSHLHADWEHLWIDCPHPNKYGTNTWGRDPGGAQCDDCGKCW